MPKIAKPKARIKIKFGDIVRVETEEGQEVDLSLDQLSGALKIFPLHDQYMTLDFDLDEGRHFANVYILPGRFRNP